MNEHERACRESVVECTADLPALERVMDLEARGRWAIKENIELLVGLRREREAAKAASAGHSRAGA